MKDIEKEIGWVVKNWKKIPNEFKTDLKEHYGSRHGAIPGVELEDHIVILLVDEQKPSVSRSYDFDEQRISINKIGEIIWGFDSGCSCPSPWHDNYPGCYSCAESWKEFKVNITSFDGDVIAKCLAKIEEIKAVAA